MAAKQIFNDILNQVEKSQLNYLVSKTPFSASISLKCSFAKASKADQDEVIVQKYNVNEAADVKAGATKSDHKDRLENEILKLKSELAFAENTILEQKHVMVDNLKQLKELAKSAENKAAEFSENLLNVKKEKKNLATQLKTNEDLNGKLKIETENMKEENKKLTEEKRNLVRGAKELKAEQATLEQINKSLEQKLEKETTSLKYHCEYCDHQSRSQGQLRKHLQTHHFRNQNHQVGMSSTFTTGIEMYSKELVIKKNVKRKEEEVSTEFEKYPCFYCDKEIDSELEALEHRVTCHGATDTPSLFSFPVRLRPLLFKCVLCGLVASCETDIVNHKKNVHGSQ